MIDQVLKPTNLIDFLRDDEKLEEKLGSIHDRLTALFKPEGVTETLLLEDLALLRMQLQDADRRRQAVLDSLQAEAEMIYFERNQQSFHLLFSNWFHRPGFHHNEMKSCRLGLEYLRNCWLKLQSACETGPIDPSFSIFSDICRDLAGTLDPRQFNDECKMIVRTYLQIVDLTDSEHFFQDWSLHVPELGHEKLRQWVEAGLRPNTNLEAQRQSLKKMVRIRLDYYKFKLASVKPIELAQQRRFAYGYRANRESNESLRNIFADRRTLQVRHDQILRMLTHLQSRRLREEARAAERAAEKAAKTTSKIQRKVEQGPLPFIPEIKRDQASEPDILSKYSPTLPIPQPASRRENNNPDTDRLLEIEIGLSEGQINDVSAADAAAILEFWNDADLYSESTRFQSVFGKLSNKILLHEIREIAASELSKRHDKNKLLDVA